MQSDVRSTYQTRCVYRQPCHGGGGGSQARPIPPYLLLRPLVTQVWDLQPQIHGGC